MTLLEISETSSMFDLSGVMRAYLVLSQVCRKATL